MIQKISRRNVRFRRDIIVYYYLQVDIITVEVRAKAQWGVRMAQNIFHDQIKGAIFEQLSEKPNLHKRNIKSAIDQVKNKYIWDTKIGLDELGKIITHFKNNWQDFKDQTKMIRRDSFVGFRRYQI